MHDLSTQEPHENGPLFTELSFYRRAAKVDISRFQLYSSTMLNTGW